MRALHYSHLFLALCAVAMIAETAFVFSLWNDATAHYTLFVFFSTLVAYNIKSALKIYNPNFLPYSDKSAWAVSNKKIFLAGYGLSLGALAFLFFRLPPGTYVLLGVMGILSITYSFPFRLGRYSFSPRNLPFVKTILVAFVWMVVVVYIPCSMNGIEPSDFLPWMGGEFAFLFSLSILFDIKDIAKDRRSGINTFPQKLGVGYTKIISVTLMAARLALILFVVQESALMAEAGICFIYLLFVVILVTVDHQEKFYMVWIDGLMLVKLVVWLVCKFYFG